MTQLHPDAPLLTDARSPAIAERERYIDSADLLGATGALLIRHQGQTYRLRQTRQGKLILTK